MHRKYKRSKEVQVLEVVIGDYATDRRPPCQARYTGVNRNRVSLTTPHSQLVVVGFATQFSN